jgi:hypothetical protein
MSYPSIRYRRRHRRPIDSQHGLAKLEHKSRLCNPRGKARAACSARRVARGSGNAETMTASSSPAPLFRMSLPRCPCQALRPCPHAIHLPEVAANAPRQRQFLSLLLPSLHQICLYSISYRPCNYVEIKQDFGLGIVRHQVIEVFQSKY